MCPSMLPGPEATLSNHPMLYPFTVCKQWMVYLTTNPVCSNRLTDSHYNQCTYVWWIVCVAFVAQVAMQQWRYHYQVVGWRDLKENFTVMGQAVGGVGLWAHLWQCALMATLDCCFTAQPGHPHHALLSLWVTLSWHWANQFLPYPNNAEHQAREWQVSILKSLVWFDQDLKTWRPDSKSWPSDSLISQNRKWALLLIRPPWLVQWLSCNYS